MERTDEKICSEIKELRSKAFSKRKHTIRRLKSVRYSLRSEKKRLQEELLNKQERENDLVVATLMSDNYSQAVNIGILHEETTTLESKINIFSATIEKIKELTALLKNEDEINNVSAFYNLLVDSISIGQTREPEFTYYTVGKLLVKVVGKKADNQKFSTCPWQ